MATDCHGIWGYGHDRFGVVRCESGHVEFENAGFAITIKIINYCGNGQYRDYRFDFWGTCFTFTHTITNRDIAL